MTSPHDNDDLADLQRQRDAINARINAIVTAKRAADAQAVQAALANRDPADFWVDPKLTAFVSERAWGNGRGDEAAHDFITRAMFKLAPEFRYFSFYTREEGADQDNSVVIVPVLSLTFGQNISGVATAIRRMMPTLVGNAPGNLDSMRVDVLERTCGEFGAVTMFVGGEDDCEAVVKQGYIEQARGTLEYVLTVIARNYWFTGGNTDNDCDSDYDSDYDY